MNSVVKQMFTVLIVVGSLSGMVLAGSYKLTKPLIEQHKLEELKQSIFVVLPDAKTYEDLSTADLQIYKGLNDKNEPAGYAFVAEGPGFQGTIRMIVGIGPDLKSLLGMQVLEQLETPGLGAKIVEPAFEEQFAGLQPQFSTDAMTAASQALAASQDKQQAIQAISVPSYITYIKNLQPDDPHEIQAITGATISSAAVVNTINRSLLLLWDSVGEQQ